MNAVAISIDEFAVCSSEYLGFWIISTQFVFSQCLWRVDGCRVVEGCGSGGSGGVCGGVGIETGGVWGIGGWIADFVARVTVPPLGSLVNVSASASWRLGVFLFSTWEH